MNNQSSVSSLVGRAFPVPRAVTPQAHVGPAFLALLQAFVAYIIMAHIAFIPRRFLAAYAAAYGRLGWEWYERDQGCKPPESLVEGI